MLAAPLPRVTPVLAETPITIRVIGVLDRITVERFAETFAELAAPGLRTFIVLMRDLAFVRDRNFDRLLKILAQYAAAGHCVYITGTAPWRKLAQQHGCRFAQGDLSEGRASRRQVMLCHSVVGPGEA